MNPADIGASAERSRRIDLTDMQCEDVSRHPLSPHTVRALRYMQDIESHTIIYLRELLATRAIDDPEVATFLACWIYEETSHGQALARFLTAAGSSPAPRCRSRRRVPERIEEKTIALVSRLWPDFVGVHMVWGAINELTTLVGYQRLAAVSRHPVLVELLARIMRDESRHFAFYFRQAQTRLASPRVARVARRLVDAFWAPVGSGVQPVEETRFLAQYLFSGDDGAAAAHKVDDTIRRLPGFADAPLLAAWVERHASGGTRRVPAPLWLRLRSNPL